MIVRTALLAALVGAGLLLGTPAVALAQQAPAGLAAPAISTAELMRATALDEVFTQFGPAIESSPHEQGVPFTAALSAAWTEAAREVFDSELMHDSLTQALDGKFTSDDYAAYAGFFDSPFGRRVTIIERAVTMLPSAAQAEAREQGIAMAQEAEGTRRAEQVEEMLHLVSAEIATSMIRQSVRGMLIGMSVTGQQGDIEVPWEEIESQLSVIMPEIEADVALTQRAMMFFAYRDLSEADLDAYLDFLRTEAARKFYALAAFSIGEIISERMEAFGETLARKLDRVNV